MATVTIEFSFSDGSTDQNEFDADGLLVAAITEYADDAVSDLNADLEDDADEIECTGWEVVDHDTDYADQQGPDDFKDLDAWGEYCEDCSRHGTNAYCLRYADVGEHDFDDEYNGCHGSFTEFAEQFFDDCMDCPDSLRCYIDYDKFARDLEYDYTTYEDSEGTHVFRNC